MRKLVRFLVTVLVGVLVTQLAVAEVYDLPNMTLAELQALKKAVENEISTNHETTYDEQKVVLSTTKNYVEQYFRSQGIEVSWAWLDYTYGKNWNQYTLKTHIDYRANGESRKPDVYSEVYNFDGDYQVTYLKIGSEVIVDRKNEIPDSRLNQAATNSQANTTSTQSETVDSSAKSITLNVTKSTDAPRPTNTPEPKRTGYGLKEKATHNGISLTLLSVKESKGSSYNKPDSGKVFLLCEFLIENNSKSSETFSTYVSFDAYVDGFSVSTDFGALLEADETLDGTVAAGKKLKGCVGYEVDKNWKDIEIHYRTGWFSDDLVFYATKK